MCIGEQPTRKIRHRSKGNVPPAKKVPKRKASDITNEVALTVIKTTTTISKADTSKINAPDATAVSACLRWKIVCC